MRTLALLSLLPAVVWAQDAYELDLSEAEVPAEFKPSIAVLGVTQAEEDPILVSRAKMLEAELTKVVQGSGKFSKVLDPSQVAQALGDEAAAARKCGDYQCSLALTKKLGVDRLVSDSLNKSGPASLLTLIGFDPALNDLPGAQIESNEKQDKQQMGGFAGLQGKTQSQKDKEFIKKATPLMGEALYALSKPNGKIAIDSAEPSSVATINGEEAGVGSFEKILGRGSYEVKVTAAGYQTFEARVTVEEQKVATVKVVLVAKPIEVKPQVVAEKSTGSPIYARPGLYVAAAGVVAVAVGIVMGVQAKSVEGRAVDRDGDGVVDVTRAQVQAAKGQATLANVLVGAGAVAVAGGGVWFFLTPSKNGVPKADDPQAPPAEGGGAFGWTAGVGGRF